MKSLVEYLREIRFELEVTLYWGVRRPEDMYLRSLAEQWQAEWSPFTFVPVVRDDEDNDWGGHHEQLVRAVLASGADWRRLEVHASGSPAMVYTLMDALTEAGSAHRCLLLGRAGVRPPALRRCSGPGHGQFR